MLVYFKYEQPQSLADPLVYSLASGELSLYDQSKNQIFIVYWYQTDRRQSEEIE